MGQFRRRSLITPRNVLLAYVVGAIALGLSLPSAEVGHTVDASPVVGFLFSVGGGVLAFVGLVYSLLILVVQFSTTAYTPRLNTFREDAPVVYHSFGLSIGLGIFCFTAALELSSQSEAPIVVPVLVMVMIAVMLASLQRLRTASVRSLQLSSILADIVTRGLDALENTYQRVPGSVGSADVSQQISLQDASEASEVVWQHRVGILQVIDLPRLYRLAETEDLAIELRFFTGDTLFRSDVVAIVYGARTDVSDAVLRSLETGPERTFEQDLRLAFRVLADIAIRALSPAVNDPTTASQSLDAMEGMLRYLATRDLDIGRVTGSDNKLRLIVPLPSWEDYLKVGVDEILAWSKNSPQTLERLDDLLNALTRLATDEKQSSILMRKNRLAAQRAAVAV